MTDDWTVGGELSEAGWARRVEGLLRFYGWRFFHAPDNKPRKTRSGREARQRVTPGFPDYVATRRLVVPVMTADPLIELVVLELKRETGRLGPGQAEWLGDFAALAAAVNGRAGADDPKGSARPHVHIGVYRPSQEAELEALLAGPRGVGVMVAGYADLEA